MCSKRVEMVIMSNIFVADRLLATKDASKTAIDRFLKLFSLLDGAGAVLHGY